MSQWIPIRLSRKSSYRNSVTLACFEKNGRTLIDIGISREVADKLGWAQSTYLAPYKSTDGIQLMLVAESEASRSARSLVGRGGNVLYVQYPRESGIENFVPSLTKRSAVEFEVEDGRLILKKVLSE